MQKTIMAMTMIMITVLQISAAEQYCVRKSATGNNDGSDWNNAYPSLPAVLVRGATYYIGDGVYGAYAFDDPENGILFIAVKKATQNEHGTDIGWDSSFGDGQAIFSEETSAGGSPILNFLTGYYYFDGITGSSGKENELSYGFKVIPVNPERKNYLLGLPGMGNSSAKVSNVTIKHTALINAGHVFDGLHTQVGIYSYTNPALDNRPENIVITNNLIADSSANIIMRRWKNCTIENNYFDSNWSSPANHGEQISPGTGCEDIILRNNIFKDSRAYVIGAHIDNNKRWKIYNNIVINGTVTGVWGNADSSHLDVMINWEVHHNTHINVTIGGNGCLYVGDLTNPEQDGSLAYNNLFYNCRNPNFNNSTSGKTAITHDYHAYFSCTGVFPLELNSIAGSIDPFRDIHNGNFLLKSPMGPGKSDLGAPYHIDHAGVLRGADGVWDMGAYEYITAGPDSTPPLDIAQVRDGPGSDISLTYSTTALSANWDSSSDAESGILKYWYSIGTTAGGAEIVPWTDNGVNTHITHTGLILTMGTTYYFSVKAENGVGLQSAATHSNGQCLSPDTLSPGIPAHLRATASYHSIHLSWQPSSDNVAVAGYEVYRNDVYITSTTAASYTDTGLTALSSYTYKVLAYDAALNKSGFSDAISLTTLPEPAGTASSGGGGGGGCFVSSFHAGQALPSALLFSFMLLPAFRSATRIVKRTGIDL